MDLELGEVVPNLHTCKEGFVSRAIKRHIGRIKVWG